MAKFSLIVGSLSQGCFWVRWAKHSRERKQFMRNTKTTKTPGHD